VDVAWFCEFWVAVFGVFWVYDSLPFCAFVGLSCFCVLMKLRVVWVGRVCGLLGFFVVLV